jgi:hypothetical protein
MHAQDNTQRQPPGVANDVVADVPVREGRRRAHGYQHGAAVQHTRVTYPRALDTQFLQLAALAANGAHDVLYAIIADSVIGKEKDSEAARARGQHGFDSVRSVCR